MSLTDAQPAVSSTAPPASGDVLGSLSETELSTWRQTGALPDREEPSTTAASTPAEPAEQAAETSASDDAPASEPGQPKKRNAETRKAELDSEIQSLLKQRAELRDELAQYTRQRTAPPPDATPDASSPSTVPPLSQVISSPDVTRPPLTDAEFFAAYPDATLVDLQRYVARYELVADRQRESVQAERHRRWTTYQDSVRKTAEADPSFKDSLSPRVLQLMPIDALPPGAAPTAQNVIAQEIVTSPSAPALLRHLSAHPEDLDRLERLPHAAAIAREIGRLEAKLETPAVPVLKTTSSAPPPPSTLGTKPSVPADDAEAAIASGDVARYIAIMNRRELAAR